MNTKIEVGDRFADRDRRNEGRVVEVRQVTADEVKVQVEVHPNNPSAVGIHRWLSRTTLLERYNRISR